MYDVQDEQLDGGAPAAVVVDAVQDVVVNLDV
jgi:hypothetical protein